MQFILYPIFLSFPNINNPFFFISIHQIILFNNKIYIAFGLIYEENKTLSLEYLLFTERQQMFD